jgi:hypothetical protein
VANQEHESESSPADVLRTKPVMKYLSSEERQRDEEDLRRVEQERQERERHDDVVDLDPLPTQDGGDRDAEEYVHDVLARTGSQVPLLQGSSGNQDMRRDSIRDSIDT